MVKPVPVLEVRDITKRFPGVLANDHINFTLHKGEIHGLLGENGAGKSTLMNIIYGLYHQDEGDILINGETVTIDKPNDAIGLGIGMVHQHFQLVDPLTVTENIMLGNEVTIGPFLNRREAERRIMEISHQYGLEVEPRCRVEDLPVGAQQRVEIVKALFRKANILILDEPTAVLTPQEAEGLFEVMRSLVSQGVSIIFITHKLKEVLNVCDRISVLRLGKVAGSTTPEESTEGSLAEMMVGREVMLQVDKAPAKTGQPVLQISDLSVLDDRDLLAVCDLSLEVRAGEILGVAGVQGNGQTELVAAITGLREVKSGQILIDNVDTTNRPPRLITELGVAHIPEDRNREGLVGPFPLIDNLAINTYYLPPFARGIIIDEQALQENAEKRIEEFDVRTPSIFVPASTLSGGNQQKVIVAREFSRPIKLLVAAQPTRGLDVGSIEFIHEQIVRKRDDGVAVLLVSAELDEIMSLSDRIAVMYDGRIVDILPIEQANRQTLGLLMAGARPEHEPIVEDATT
jgi:simple sugar transport system ATP-binding protein